AAVPARNPAGPEGGRPVGVQYVGPPILASVSPPSGPVGGGTRITIDGGGFQAGATVTFGGSAASDVVVSPTRITCTSPPHAAGPVEVTVRNPDGQSASLPEGFVYVPPPRVDRVEPSFGPAAGGTPVTIGGAGFLAGAQVFFGGSPAAGVSVPGSDVIRCLTPAHAAGAVDVVVRNPDGQQGTLPAGFQYRPGPFIESVSPASGPAAGGTEVTILGGAFESGAAVLFGDTPAAAVTVVSAAEIRATTPARAAGAADVIVRNPDGQSAIRAGGFTFIAAPRIDRVDPAGGPAQGG
ncbi:MAG: IPT/TIG domain-containing protein, partial [Planctomycetota bacterium]